MPRAIIRDAKPWRIALAGAGATDGLVVHLVDRTSTM